MFGNYVTELLIYGGKVISKINKFTSHLLLRIMRELAGLAQCQRFLFRLQADPWQMECRSVGRRSTFDDRHLRPKRI